MTLFPYSPAVLVALLIEQMEEQRRQVAQAYKYQMGGCAKQI